MKHIAAYRAGFPGRWLLRIGLVLVVAWQGSIRPVAAESPISTTNWPTRVEIETKWKDVPLETVERTAEAGEATAQHYLGLCLQNGERIARDYSQAMRWYQKANQAGFLPSTSNIGVLHVYGLGVPKDPVEAVRFFRRAALGGLAQGRHNLGLMLKSGSGIGLDPEEAVKWFRLAAAQGHRDALFELYLAYRDGNGAEEDLAEARTWLSRAAEAGHPWGQAELGIWFEQKETSGTPQAVHWYRRSAEQGWSGGQYRFGLCHLQGKGVFQDEEKGLELIRAAADQNHSHAQHELAKLYARGIGRPRDENDRPMELLLRAVATGHAEANRTVSDRYKTGLGVERDFVEAAHWYCRAAAAFRWPGVLEKASRIPTVGAGESRNQWAPTLADYLLASGSNDTASMMSVGRRYLNGQNVPLDRYRAWAWFAVAADLEDPDAIKELSILEATLSMDDLVTCRKQHANLIRRLKSDFITIRDGH